MARNKTASWFDQEIRKALSRIDQARDFNDLTLKVHLNLFMICRKVDKALKDRGLSSVTKFNLNFFEGYVLGDLIVQVDMPDGFTMRELAQDLTRVLGWRVPVSNLRAHGNTVRLIIPEKVKIPMPEHTKQASAENWVEKEARQILYKFQRANPHGSYNWDALYPAFDKLAKEVQGEFRTWGVMAKVEFDFDTSPRQEELFVSMRIEAKIPRDLDYSEFLAVFADVLGTQLTAKNVRRQGNTVKYGQPMAVMALPNSYEFDAGWRNASRSTMTTLKQIQNRLVQAELAKQAGKFNIGDLIKPSKQYYRALGPTTSKKDGLVLGVLPGMSRDFYIVLWNDNDQPVAVAEGSLEMKKRNFRPNPPELKMKWREYAFDPDSGGLMHKETLAKKKTAKGKQARSTNPSRFFEFTLRDMESYAPYLIVTLLSDKIPDGSDAIIAAREIENIANAQSDLSVNILKQVAKIAQVHGLSITKKVKNNRLEMVTQRMVVSYSLVIYFKAPDGALVSDFDGRLYALANKLSAKYQSFA